MPNKEPYKMYPGKHSEVNPGNFKGSEVVKYKAMKMHPMKFEDQKGTGPGVTQADVIKARTEGYNPKAHHPMGYVSDAQRKAVHASKADGGKGKPQLSMFGVTKAGRLASQAFKRREGLGSPMKYKK
jgi:hypothetical protein